MVLESGVGRRQVRVRSKAGMDDEQIQLHATNADTGKKVEYPMQPRNPFPLLSGVNFPADVEAT
jgi:hypothetical protein